ncbi:hypothetical protein [uncultured Herbaspirillum sp.]|uniref:hypothetical protein n=1 Tax=uncultured Herbaspirillum sp. TaxID=160236 RepID=UPI00258CC83C|nr:hypothetical protein [uncultured Herbaspirillum sp.]
MNRSDLEYALIYSSVLERLTAAFWGRLDKATVFFQLCLGASVFAEIANMKIIGAFLTAVSMWSLVFSPTARSLTAEQQRQQYEGLCVRAENLSDEDLAKAFEKIQERDSPELAVLSRLAEHAAHIRLGATPPYPLKWFDRVFGLLAGA